MYSFFVLKYVAFDKNLTGKGTPMFHHIVFMIYQSLSSGEERDLQYLSVYSVHRKTRLQGGLYFRVNVCPFLFTCCPSILF